MSYPVNRKLLGAFISVALIGSPVVAQYSPQSQPVQNYNNAPPSQPLSAQQLDDLVAPIALYPDPLVGEVLAASTYPMEIAEAEQWGQDHQKWKPAKLMDEAKKQNWDPSVQGLVAFPQVLSRLTQDMGWTTAMGNAFLAQQAEVMQAIQRMRAQAEKRGTLRSSPQEVVNTANEGGQSAIDIEPADPNVWYVPDYNPTYVWGPPAYGYYPPLLYPGIGVGFGWGPGIDLGLFFGGWGGWGWGGWGWGPNWFGGGLFINNSFFHRFGFREFHGAAGFGRSAWAHNPDHRLGVPYGNREVANRFEGRSTESGGFNRGGITGRQQFVPQRQAQKFGSRGFDQRGYTAPHSVFGGYHNGGATRMQSDHGFSSMGASRGFGGGGFHGGGGGFHGGGGRR
jgi:hypothetical protein